MEYVEPIDQEFVCAVCKLPWSDPKVTACEHIFCEQCIGDMLLKNSGRCPTCNEPVEREHLKAPLPQLLKLADKSILVYCPNRHAVPPCTETVKRADLAGHVEKCRVELKYVDEATISEELLCSICHQPWTNPQEINHCRHIFCTRCLQQSRRTVADDVFKCPLCTQPYTVLDLRAPSRPVLNMLEGLTVHCPLAKATGCTWTGKRSDMASHVQPSHTVILAAAPLNVVPPPPAAAPSAALISLTSLNEFDVVKTGQADHKVVSMAHIEAPARPESAPRKPISISAVIDVSGSMQGEKLDLVKTALRFMVSELQSHDELGIIAFDDKISEPLTIKHMNQHGKDEAIAAIASLKADGYTNLSGGLFAGIDQVRGLPFDASDATRSRPRKVSLKVTPPSNAAPSRSPPKKGGIISSITSMFKSHADPVPDKPAAAPPCSISLAVNHTYTKMKRNAKWLHVYRVSFTLTECSGPKQPEECVKALVVKYGATSVTVPFGKVGSKLPATVGTTNIESDVELDSAQILLEFHPEYNFAPVSSTHVFGKEAEEGHVCFTSTLKYGPPPVATVTTAAASESMRYVWIFTDGLANEGIQNPDELIAATKLRLDSHPVELSGIFSFGFGTDHSADLLRKIAESCQGSYYFIKSTEHIKGVFGECLGGLLSIVAQNITLEIRTAEGVKVSRLMTSLVTDSSNRIVMKDLYSEEARDVLVELLVSTPVKEEKSFQLLSWVLRYTDINGVVQEIVRQGAVQVSEFLPPGLKPNSNVDEQRNRILITEALEEAKKKADEGRIAEAQRVLAGACEIAKASASAETAVTAQLCRDVTTAITATEDWHSGGKVVSQMANMHRMQRSNAMEECEAYQTSTKCAKKACAKAFK